MEAVLVASSSAKATIRRLSPSDLYQIVPFAQEYVREQPQPGGFDVQRFLDFWTTLLAQFSGVILVAEADGELVGGISGYLVPDAYTQRLLAQEGFFYVIPARRQTNVALRLFGAFLQWADETPTQATRVGHLMGDHAKSLEQLFHRHGFRPIETHYEKERELCQPLSL